jgi:tetratricopeptide (TPR) repeat protein
MCMKALACRVAVVLALLVAALPGLGARPLPPLEEAGALAREAEAMWQDGDLDAIAARLRLAISLAEPLVPADDPGLGAVLGMLCRNGFNRGDFAEAEPACRRALAISERQAPGTVETARLMGDLAAVLRNQRQWDEAERLLRVSLPMRLVLGHGETAWYASGLDNLARALVGQWRLTEALPLAEEAYALRARLLGEAHPLTQDSRVLAESVRSLVANWRRLSAWSLWLLGGGFLGAAAFAGLTVRAERHGKAPGWIVPLLAWGGGCAFGVATALGGAVLLAQSFPETSWARQAGKAAYAIGQFGGLLLAGGIANLLRRRAGLPRQVLMQPLAAPTADELPSSSRSVEQAVSSGLMLHALLMVPVLAGGVALLIAVISIFDDGQPMIYEKHDLVFIAHVAVIAVCAVSYVSFLIVLPTAIFVPRWRVWAMARVEDLDALEREAVRWWLLPPRNTAIGRWSLRGEWWTRKLRERARQLRAGRGHPSWSGDI